MSQPIIISESSADSGSAIGHLSRHECDYRPYY
jgi:hypothetical protein